MSTKLLEMVFGTLTSGSLFYAYIYARQSAGWIVNKKIPIDPSHVIYKYFPSNICSTIYSINISSDWCHECSSKVRNMAWRIKTFYSWNTWDSITTKFWWNGWDNHGRSTSWLTKYYSKTRCIWCRSNVLIWCPSALWFVPFLIV